MIESASTVAPPQIADARRKDGKRRSFIVAAGGGVAPQQVFKVGPYLRKRLFVRVKLEFNGAVGAHELNILNALPEAGKLNELIGLFRGDTLGDVAVAVDEQDLCFRHLQAPHFVVIARDGRELDDLDMRAAPALWSGRLRLHRERRRTQRRFLHRVLLGRRLGHDLQIIDCRRLDLSGGGQDALAAGTAHFLAGVGFRDSEFFAA
jgi:hypothetical protein